jgi:hypothetical protein
MNNNERLIVESIIDYVLGKGLVISINDGENDSIKHCPNVSVLKEALDTTGTDHMFFHKPCEVDGFYSAMGWIWFIYGNGNNGLDIITDSSTGPLIMELEQNIINPLLESEINGVINNRNIKHLSVMLPSWHHVERLIKDDVLIDGTHHLIMTELITAYGVDGIDLIKLLSSFIPDLYLIDYDSLADEICDLIKLVNKNRALYTINY